MAIITVPYTAPDWATNTDFAAGSNPWSGQPNKSAPSSGKVQSGYTPGTDDAAEEDNFILNNHGAWHDFHDAILRGGNFLVLEDFLDTTLSTKWTVTGTHSIIDDHAAGQWGALKMNPSASGSVTLNTAATLPAIAGDAATCAVMRLGAAMGTDDNGALCLGNPNGSHFLTIGFNQGVNSGRWYTQLDTATVVDTGVTPTTTPQTLAILRQNGTAFFYINNALIRSATYATTISSEPFYLAMQDGGAGTAQWLVDSVKMWAAR